MMHSSGADVDAFSVALNRDIEGNKATLNNQPTNPNQNHANAAKNQKQVSFAKLLFVIVPQLDNEKRQQLEAPYIKMRRNEVSKEEFLRLMQEVVGDQMIQRAIYKLQNQDERMHSSADVDAFTAALNRDIEGSNSTSQPSGSNSCTNFKKFKSSRLSQGSNYRSNYSVSHWHNSTLDENSSRQVQQDMTSYQRQEPHISSMVGNSSLQTLPIQAQRVQNQQTMPPQHPANLQRTNTQKTISPQHPLNLQRTSNQQMMPPQHPANFQQVNNQPTNPNKNSANAAKKQKYVSFGKFFSAIIPQLDKDKRQQVQALYIKLRRNEDSKEGSLRLIKEIVGDQMIKLTLIKLQKLGKAIDFVPANAKSYTITFDNMFTSEAPNTTPISGQSSNLKTTSTNGPRQVNFSEFLPLIARQVDENKIMQLKTLYDRMRRNEVSKEEFLRLMEELIGEKVVKLAVHKLLTKEP